MFNQSSLRKRFLPIIVFIFVISACSLPTNLTTAPPTSVPSATFTGVPPLSTAGAVATPVVPSGIPTPTPVPPTSASTPAMLTPLSVAVNCRYGPATTYLVLADLLPGHTVPILGTNSDRNWWQIQDPDNSSVNCWVGNPVVITSGDIAAVPVVPIPGAYVIKVKVTINATIIHGTCGEPNPNNWTGYISTNGPVTVTFHWEIWNTGGSRRNATADQNLVFPSATTLSDYPGSLSEDCGNYTVKLIVTSPNNVSDQAQWQVVHP